MKKLALALTALLTISLPLQAQDESIGELVNKGLAAMNEGNWPEALKVHTTIEKEFGGEDALANYGPKFGILIYRKGISEMKLKQYDAAIASFESCYKDFPNTKEKSGNSFNKQALLKWGEAAMGAGKYQVAIDQWKKFLVERDKAKDKYPRGSFHVNMALCYFNLGELKDGSENLEIAITNKNTFPTTPDAILSGFQGLAAAAIKAKDEQVISDFLGKTAGRSFPSLSSHIVTRRCS